MLDAIVVEGEKIERGFLDTYSSVGVLTAEDLEERNVDDLREAFEYLGNVRFFEGNRGNNGFVIRGLNSEGVTQPTNNAPLTSVIIDGATQSVESTRRGARGLWDVEQVEVYRGPQSTLQGRGALAGAVILETRDPTYSWEFGGETAVGQNERMDGAFVVSGPIVEDQVAFRLSGEARRQDLDIDYTVPENRVLAEDRYRNLRAKLLVEPAAVPELSVLLTASTTFDRPGVRTVNGDDFFDREFTTGPTTAVEIREATNDNYVADATWRAGEALTLRSVTAFVDSELDITTPAGLSFARDETRAGRDVTQDFRATFGDGGDRLSGVLGAFFGNFTLPRSSRVTTNGGRAVVQDLTSDDRTRNFSVYGDLRWEFVPDLSLLAGARVTHEEVRNEARGVSFGNRIDTDAAADFTVFLPKAGLAWELAENQRLAATAQRGYRSGFTEVAGGEVNTVEPEFLWNFELAYRTEAPAGGWSFGATAFHYRYADQQIPVTRFEDGIPVTRTGNAGRSRAFGGEIDARYAFDNGFSLFGALGLLHTEFRDLATSAGDFSGNEFPEAPTVTAAVGGTWRHATGAFVSGDVTYTGSYFSTGSIENDPVLEVDSHVEVGLRAGYEAETWRVMLYAENLLDAEIVTSLSNNQNFGAPPVEATIADGRRIGVEVRIDF